MEYPSTTEDTRMATCYVCTDVVDKKYMRCIGPDKSKPGHYIYRCEDCQAGSEKWRNHFMHRSSLRALFIAAEGKTMSAELQKTVGKQLVEAEKERNEREICARLDAKKAARTDDSPGRPIVSQTKAERQPATTKEKGGARGKPKRSWRTVKIRRGR